MGILEGEDREAEWGVSQRGARRWVPARSVGPGTSRPWAPSHWWGRGSRNGSLEIYISGKKMRALQNDFI